ncbi:NADH-quinone oxidoreductase subunit C [Dehalococcoidia bacterium]|nr:NADH-quinone oxidoreductase subunit C [Dehalococcoidia bacterium]
MSQAHGPPPGPDAPVKPDPHMEELLGKAMQQFDGEFGYAVDEVSVVFPREQLAEACALAKNDDRLRFDYLRCLAVTEYEEYFQVSYMLWSTEKTHRAIFKVNAPKDDPVVPSVTEIWSGADWHEREGAELFGVVFAGHPDPRHLLLFEEFEGKYPLRKDYPFEEVIEWTDEMTAPWEAQP